MPPVELRERARVRRGGLHELSVAPVARMCHNVQWRNLDDLYPRRAGVTTAALREYGVSVKYVALLRGINVGGKTLVKMADLRTCAEELGLDEVSTFIASGNLLFESRERSAARLETKIERAIEKRFELPVKVVVLDRAAYARIVKAIPKSWAGDKTLRANVAFVRRGTNAKEVVRQLQPDAAVEEVKALDGAILWATKRDAVMRKLIGGAAYKELTVRNLNTTLKLQELMAD
jgi:uncharacterized protein (DUF1697 family)